MRNYPKLSWKSTTCDAVTRAPDRPEQDRRRFATAPFAADLIPKISMSKTCLRPNISIIPYIIGTANGIQFAGRRDPNLFCGNIWARWNLAFPKEEGISLTLCGALTSFPGEGRWAESSNPVGIGRADYDQLIAGF